jgi:mevalonate kinase
VLRVPAWKLEARAGDGSQVGEALQALLGELDANGLDLDGEAALPPSAGLGSSAAFSVAAARAVMAATGRPEEPARIAAAAAAAEMIFHGAPSGVDAAAAARGGVGRFTRAEGWTAISLPAPFKLCIGLSGRVRNTRTLVTRVGQLLEREPRARRIVDMLGELADAGVGAVRDGDVSSLAGFMDLAHGLLAALGVSSPELEALVHGARAAGAEGAKLTGAGGGGAVIALAPGREHAVLERWNDEGFDGFVTEVRP